MRISHRCKFIFFSNPKTGSESIRAMLSPFNDVPVTASPKPGNQFRFHSHMRPAEARAEFTGLGWDFDGYYKFTFVRNPWKRLASLYEMILRLDKNYRKSFDYWLRHSQPDGIGGGGPNSQSWRKFGAYSIKSFAGDKRGRLLVNEVFRLEDIDAVPNKLRERGIPLPPGARAPRINAARPLVPYRERYTPASIQLVAERYAEDIERFNYEF